MRGRSVTVARQQTSDTESVRFASADTRGHAVGPRPPRRSAQSKRLVPRVLVRILLALVHLLLERLSFLLVGEREAGQTLLELKRVEEGAVLVVGEGVVDFLVPQDATIGRRYID